MDIKCPKCGQGPDNILYVEKREHGFHFSVSEADGHVVVDTGEDIGDSVGIEPFFECHNLSPTKTTIECLETWPVPEEVVDSLEWV